MLISPGQDLPNAQAGQSQPVAHTAVLRQKLRQRGTTRQTAATHRQVASDGGPSFAGRVQDGAQLGIRPSAGAPVVRVDPL
jgi:hypothetical protein